MPVTITGAGTASGVTSVPNLQSFPAGPRLANVNMPVGSVLQVVSTTKTDKFSYSAADTNFYDVTGLSASITPSSTSSKILVMASVLISDTNASYYSLMGVRIARSGTAVGTGTASFASGIASVSAADSSSAYASVPLLYLDSPSSTSALTYNIQINQRIGGTVVIQVNADRGGSAIGSSTITVMEIAA